MVKRKTIPSDIDEARRLAEDLLQRVQAAGFHDDVLFAIRLALEEALVNAIKHGNKSDPSKRVTVLADVRDGRASITVRDEGAGFDPSTVPDPTADENLEKPSGRGLMLMRAYMDEVHFNDRGNEVRMIKQKR